MKFTDIFIHRPVLATALSLVILLLGLRAYTEMTVREYPAITNTVVTVTTAYPGANPNTIQGFVTTRLERVIASAPGIDYMTSNSSEGMSTITVYMKLNYSPNAAVANIQSKVQQVTNELPAGSQLPVINVTVGNTTDLMYIAFYSDQLSQQQITDYLLRVVQPKLASVSGVGEAQILPPGSGNGNTYSMRVWLNPRKMAALGISAAQVSQVLAANDFISAVGSTRGTETGDTIVATTNLHDAAQFRNLVVKNVGNTIIRLKDIAQVELGAQNYDSSAYFDGKPAAFVGIQEAPSANSLNVAAGVKAALAELGTALPPGMHMAIPYDATDYIKASIDEVLLTIGITLAVVVLVIFLFLGSFRSVLIPAVAIPLSIIGAGFIMWAMGFTINLLTLLAVVLAIGLVVDDAIIVVENVSRHLEEGLSPMDAAIQAARELANPIIAMTIVLVAVYVPIGFMSGLTGALFTEFAFTLVGAVTMSAVIALTLSPMMCSKLLRAPKPEGGNWIDHLVLWLDRQFTRLDHAYERRLDGVLNHLSVVAVFAVLLLGGIYFLYTTSMSELAPQEDQGVLIAMTFSAPDAGLMQRETQTAAIRDVFNRHSETEHIFQLDMPTQTISGMVLKPWDQRTTNANVLQPIVQQELNGIAGSQNAVFQPPPLPGARGFPVQFVLTTTEPFAKLYDVSQKFLQEAMKSGNFIFLQSDLRIDLPQTTVVIDRDKAAALGLSMADIGNSLSTLLGGNYVNYFDMAGRSYKVIPQVQQRFRLNADQLKNYYLRSASGDMVALSNVAHLQTSTEPETINHFQQQNMATIQGVNYPTVSQGQALAYLKDLAQRTLPPNYGFDYSGPSRQYIQESGGLLLTFFFAIIIIFLALAAQFESFRDPVIILVSVPMSIAGALIFINLGIGGASLNIYTEVGLVTLIGLISKHGILIVEFANNQQRAGLSKRDAIEKAAGLRLRPILMTTAAMVLGVVPLIIAHGAGAVSRFNLGLVIASGLSIGTLFTLFVVPGMYMLMATDHSKQ